MKLSWKTTINACFAAYIVQAVINNFAPLLFLTFQRSYSIPLSRITMLVAINFGVQIATDLAAAKFVDKIGARRAIVLAHILSAAGLVMLAVLPGLLPPFAGILIAVAVYAVGGGLLEVLVSPITESCPTEGKEAAMSLLHSFYCWGHVAVVLISTAFFAACGIQNWKILALIWALIPLANAAVFAKTPIAPLISDGERGMTLGELARSRIFWVLILMMAAAGASEQAVSQWASAFAERGLGISKTAGDLAGPLSFAVCMGSSRAIYGKFGGRMDLRRFMIFSAGLCIAAYLVISLSPIPAISLAGCAVCGFSVGIMWPGTFSRAAASLRNGGTAMFALLALAGDLGCAGGPTLVGLVSDAAGGEMKLGILAGVIFPLAMLACLVCGRGERKNLKGE